MTFYVACRQSSVDAMVETDGMKKGSHKHKKCTRILTIECEYQS